MMPEDPAPTITNVSPDVGMVGTEVTITGTNFSSVLSENTVEFNGVDGTLKSASRTRLVVDVPQGATTGPVSLTVNSRTIQGPIFTVTNGVVSLCDETEITVNTTWEDRVPGDAIDYVVDCEIVVIGNALLTIEPGVVIAFEGNLSGIFTNESGGLKAVGTDADPIVFKGTSENKGVWKGIFFGSDHPENRLEQVTVMHAGRSASGQSGEKGAVQLSRRENSEAAIVSCTITNNEGYGLFVTDESELTAFSNNTLSDNEDAPVGLYFNQLGALDANSDYDENGEDYIEVRENEIDDDEVTLAALNVPYRFIESRRYNITNELEILPGGVLQFVSGSGLRLGVQATDCGVKTGSLNATGTSSDPIVFEGITSGTGAWLGIGFNSSSPNNRLIHCVISGGGSSKLYNAADFGANVTLQCESRVTIQNTTITESGGHGIYLLDEDAILSEFESNTLSGNTLAPIWLHLPQVDDLDASTSFGDGNGSQFIQVRGESVLDADLTLKKLDVPYRVETDFVGRETYVERNITIEAGTILEFETGAGLILGSPGVDCIPTTGSLNAEGTSDQPIIFRGASPGQGSWLGLGINSSSDQNRLIHCEISGGGASQMYNAGGQGSIVMHCESSLVLQNSTIKDSGGWGIDFVQGNNMLSQSDNTFSNNALGDIAPD
jgi:hypothetical protein